MTVTTANGTRDVYHKFWNKYSDTPTNNSMLLNKNADELASRDSDDILASLPDFTGKVVADIAAGIGRFTTLFSQTAAHVTSVDFIESFIAKNKERNAGATNITYIVSDAAHLELEAGSYDLVFTNWLAMYMDDKETVQFVFNTLKWLRPGGMFKFRESCSEPSTGRKKDTGVHTGADHNPTHYRHCSLYIELLRQARFRDPEGQWWRYHVKWSTSVPTYIERMSNWRQVHWLAEKVPCTDDSRPTLADLVHKLSVVWPAEQQAADDALLSAPVWTQKILADHLRLPATGTVLAYNPRDVSADARLDWHAIAAAHHVNVWTIETSTYAYQTALTRATEIKDQRVRFGWNESLGEAVDYLASNEVTFDAFVGVELLSTADSKDLTSLTTRLLAPQAPVVLLEPLTVDVVSPALTKSGLAAEQLTDVSAQVAGSVAPGHPAASRPWTLVKARIVSSQ